MNCLSIFWAIHWNMPSSWYELIKWINLILCLFLSPYGSSNFRGPDQTSSLCTESLLMIVFYLFPVQYCVWTDGLNALLGKDMLSDLTRNDLDTLLSMEIKLRLLDLENIQIPDAPPPIPKEPSNYDFVYDCNWGCHWNLLQNWKYYNWRDIEKKKEECEGKNQTLVHLGFWLWGGV